MTTVSASRAAFLAGSIPATRELSPNASKGLLPLNCFQWPETRMNTRFIWLRHHTLPSFIPS